MSPDIERQTGATHPDQPWLAATTSDSEFSLSIEDVGDLYSNAGLPRDLRTIQRYCRRGRLEARLVEFPYGEKYFITPTSVERHIAFLKELRQAAADRGEPRPAAASDAQEIAAPTEAQPAATSTDQPRPAEAYDVAMSRYVAHLEGENAYLREQSAVKDDQIKDLTERAHETNVLIGSLQKMLTPLLGRGSTAPPKEHMHTYTPNDGEGENTTSV